MPSAYILMCVNVKTLYKLLTNSVYINGPNLESLGTELLTGYSQMD